MTDVRLIQDYLAASRIVPVVIIDDAAATDGLVTALLEGGIRAAEFTLRTPAGLAALETAAQRSDFIAGAGTVLTPEQVDRCADAGARFIVSPGLDRTVVERALQRGLLALPGVATATEVQAAIGLGLDCVKFFPAEQLGGVAMIDALAGPFPEMRFFPSGGIGQANCLSYLSSPSVLAIGGSWMAPRSAIERNDFARIAVESRRAVELISGAAR